MDVVKCIYDQRILHGQKSLRVGMGIQQFRRGTPGLTEELFSKRRQVLCGEIGLIV